MAVSAVGALLILGLVFGVADAVLSVRNTEILQNGMPTFLNGVNQAWVNYGRDFGNNDGAKSLPSYISTYNAVAASTGNVVRLWVHCGCDATPKFDPSTPGQVVATDNANTLISDIVANVKAAAARKIVPVISLFNGAVKMPSNERALITSPSNTQSYVDVVLKPLVSAVAATGADVVWEVGNELEGSVLAGQSADHPCQDTTVLSGTGAGWTGSEVPMKDLQVFVASITSAIHSTHGGALVTVGSWSQYASTSAFPGMFDYWSDECLSVAGEGAGAGVSRWSTGNSDRGAGAGLDIRQIHSYANAGKWTSHSPFVQVAADFKLDKPLMIGEFSAMPSGWGAGFNITMLYNHACRGGYVGGMGWAVSGGSSLLDTMEQGMRSVCHGAPNPPPGGCKDIPPPPGTYSCAQQKAWGKCGESWMTGYCCKSCFQCATSCTECGDLPSLE